MSLGIETALPQLCLRTVLAVPLGGAPPVCRGEDLSPCFLPHVPCSVDAPPVRAQAAHTRPGVLQQQDPPTTDLRNEKRADAHPTCWV